MLQQRVFTVKAFMALLVLMLFGLQYKLWLAPGGITTLWQLRNDLTVQQQSNLALRQHNQALSAEVQDLKHGTDAMEERARMDLGMVAHNEHFYRIVD